MANNNNTGRAPLIAVPVILVAGILTALNGSEGRKLTPYRDTGGVWTVCDGITGKAVIPGRKYTDAECAKLGQDYVNQMLVDMGQCVKRELDFNVIKATGHFAYNVGTPAFCRSTMARNLNAGDIKGACAEITKWVFVAGKDCRDPKNNCRGIVKRREWERATCEGRTL